MPLGKTLGGMPLPLYGRWVVGQSSQLERWPIPTEKEQIEHEEKELAGTKKKLD